MITHHIGFDDGSLTVRATWFGRRVFFQFAVSKIVSVLCCDVFKLGNRLAIALVDTTVETIPHFGCGNVLDQRSIDMVSLMTILFNFIFQPFVLCFCLCLSIAVLCTC